MNDKFKGLGVPINGIMSGTIEPPRKYDYEHLIVHAGDEFPSDTVVIQQGDTVIFSEGNLSTITGLAKSRKTFLVASLIAGFLNPEGFMGLTSDLTEKKVLLIDTEQAIKDVWVVTRRIYRLMRWDFTDKKEDVLQVVATRELTPDNRWETAKKAISQFHPTLVFIDGSADLITDPNNIEQSTTMVNNLMRLSSEMKCHICSVVHTNPNSDKTRGHFGSELQRKSETVMLVVREGDFTAVKPQFTRNIEFTQFAFRINETGLPEPSEMVIPKQEDLRAILEEVYSYSEFLSYGDLRDRLMGMTGKGKTACENRIKKGLDAKIIYRDIEANYRLYIEASEKKLPFKEDEGGLPF